MRICAALEDRRVWVKDPSGHFSCKRVFEFLTSNSNVPDLFQIFWKAPIPSKVKVFMWLLTLGKLSAHDVLRKRSPFHMFIFELVCSLCQNLEFVIAGIGN